MSQTLYRKYRPQTFADVIGQEHVVTALINQIKHDQVAHAYLFAGPRGVGKTTTARLLARAVQAHDPKTGEPDEKDAVVQSMIAGSSMDVVEIDAASNRRIEEVRELREHVKYPPNNAKMKVFIIDEVHMLTTEAFNALLKTLEEPPSYVLFILATTELHKLPDTIISRCQRFDFYPVKPHVLQTRLEKLATAEGIEVDEGVLHTIVKLSGGCVRDAESLLGQVLSLGSKKITAEEAGVLLPTVSHEWISRLWQSFVEQEQKSSLQIVQEIYQSGADIVGIFDDLLELMRHIMIWKIDPNNNEHIFVITHESVEVVKQSSGGVSLAVVQKIISILLEHKQHVGISPLPHLPLEMACVSIHQLLGGNDTPDSDTPNSASIKPQSNQNAPTPDIEESPGVHNAELWNPALELITKEQPALAQYLTSADVQYKGSKVIITVGHAFHFEIAKKEQSIAIVEGALAQLLGKKVGVHIHLNEQIQKRKNSESSAVKQITEVFGGQIVPE
ncbi:MAG: DNA polymerase III subunit gamma/tau [Patescibacteria group bacterium]